MADKSVKELAQMVKKTPVVVLQQLKDAGLPARGEDDLVTEHEQERLVAFLKESHGQEQKRRISLKSKTTSTAKMTGTSGKAKSINVERRKKINFEKPDPVKQAEELKAKVKAAEEAKIKAAEEAKAKKQAEADAKKRQEATLAAMRKSLGGSKSPTDTKAEDVTASVVVKKGSKVAEAVKA